jgi:hypothetical protein
VVARGLKTPLLDLDSMVVVLVVEQFLAVKALVAADQFLAEEAVEAEQE